MNQKNKKKNIYFGAGILALLAAYLSLFIFVTGGEEAEMSNLSWAVEANILAISNAVRENNTGVLFIKLKDGGEQFIAGNWNTSFTDQGNVYVYGEFPEGYSKQIGQQLYYIQNGEQIFDIELSGLSGVITEVEENPLTTYMLIEATGLSEQGKPEATYCIAPRVGVYSVPKCDQINWSGAESEALWNPEEDREVVAIDVNGSLLTFDPWEGKPNNIYLADQPELYEEMAALFERSFDPSSIQTVTDTEKKLYKFLNFALVQDEGGWSFYKVPLISRIAWLSDANHILIKAPNELSILELDTKKLAPVLEEANIGFKEIELRNKDFDQRV